MLSCWSVRFPPGGSGLMCSISSSLICINNIIGIIGINGIKLVFSDMTGGIDGYSHMPHELLSFCSKLRRHKIYIVFHTSILPLGTCTVKDISRKKNSNWICNNSYIISNIDNRSNYNAFFSRMSELWAIYSMEQYATKMLGRILWRLKVMLGCYKDYV